MAEENSFGAQAALSEVAEKPKFKSKKTEAVSTLACRE